MSEWNIKLGDHARALSDAEDALEIYQMLQSSQEVKARGILFKGPPSPPSPSKLNPLFPETLIPARRSEESLMLT